MVKVLIVDDELLVRVGIRSTVNWNKIGITVVAEAENGEEGWHQYQVYQPEIVITDIKMPVMDGLQLTSKIKQMNARAKIIILTCHGEFDYAKEAIRLGAFEYILKPTMMGNDLEQILMNAKTCIIEEQNQHQRVTELENKVNEHSEAEKEKWRIAVMGGMQIDEAHQLEKPAFPYMPLLAMAIRIDQYHEVQEKYEGRNHISLWEAIKTTIAGIVNKYGSAITIYDHQSQCIIAVCSFMEMKSEKAIYEKQYHIAQEMKETIRRFFGFPITIGLGDKGDNYDSIQQITKHAIKAVDCRLFLGGDCIISYQQSIQSIDTNQSCREVLQQLRSHLKAGDLQEVNESLYALFYEQLMPSFSTTLVKETVFELISILIMFVKERLPQAQISGADYEQYEWIMGMETMNQMAQWFQEKFTNLLTLERSSMNTNDYSVQVKEVILFIQSHFMENIDLADAAKVAYLSKNYIGNLFKKDTDQYFNEYLMEYRLEKAKVLLRDYTLKVYDIAMKVGIHDQRYFSKSFKKYTGKTPNEFREYLM